MSRAGLRALSAALTLVAAPACSDGGPALPRRPVETTIDATTAAGTARVWARMSSGDEAETQETITGVIDLETRVRSTTTRVTFEPTDEAPKVPPDPPPIYAFVDDSFVYLKGERVTENLPGDPEWVRLVVDSVRPDMVVPFGFGADPAGVLDLLSGATDAIEDRGVEGVRGVEARRFGVEIDTELLLRRAPDDGAARATVSFLEAVGFGSVVPADVWIDSESRLVRLRLASPADADPPTTVTIELYDFGIELDGEAPQGAVLVSVFDLTRPPP